MFVCFCATPNILLTLITWSLGNHASCPCVSTFAVTQWLVRRGHFCQSFISSSSCHVTVPITSAVLFPFELLWLACFCDQSSPSILGSVAAQFLQLQLSRALYSFRGEKKDKLLVRWERFYNRLLSFVPHTHAHIHSLEQRMVSGVATTGSCPGIRSTVQDSEAFAPPSEGLSSPIQ